MLKEKIGKALKACIKSSGAATRIVIGIGATVLTFFAFKKRSYKR